MANIAQTTDFRVRKGLVVENTATILSTIGTVSTNSGALQVTGGVGIGGGLFVGGTVTATNFYSNGTGGSLTGASLISTVAFTATTATITSLYMVGGAAGSIPIQNAAGAMAFIPQGTTGYVLTAAAGNTATWSALSGLSAGTATNAINILTQAQPLSGTYYPTFVNANNNVAAYVSEFTTSSFSINPATGSVNAAYMNVTNQGTASQPAFTFGATNRGIYNPAGGDLGFVASGYLQLYLAGTNPATNYLQIAGGLTGAPVTLLATGTDAIVGLSLITKNNGSVIVPSTSATISTTTGALIVAGGLGVGGDAYHGGIIQGPKHVVSGSYSSADWGITGTGLAVVASTYTNLTSSGVVANSSINAFGIPTIASLAATTITSAATVYIAGVPLAGTNTTITNAYSLRVAGAVSNFSGQVQAANFLIQTTAGILVQSGVTTVPIANTNATTINFAGSATTISIGATTGATTFNATTPTISTNTGALQVVGGVGIAGGLFVGTSVTATNVYANIYPNNTATMQVGYASTAGSFNTATMVANAVNAGFATTATTAINVQGGAAGSIPIQSAAGTTAYIPIGTGGQILTVSGSTASWTSLSGLSAGSATTATNLAGGTAGQIPYQANPGSTGFTGPGTAGQLLLSNGTSAPSYSSSIPSLIVSNSTTATSTVTGAFQVVGGVGIGGSLVVGGTMQVAGATTFGGPVTFSGPATYILSTNTYWTDNILELHTTSTGVTGQWTGPDGKDIGFRFHYYNRALSTDSNAALVLADDSQVLEWYGTGAESNTGTFSSATYGTFKTGAIQLRNGVGTTNATSGDLQVAGGVGIGGGLFVGGVLTATIHSSPTSITFNVNNANSAIILDANRNVLLGGTPSVLNSVNAGSIVQLGDAGSSLSTAVTPYIFFNGKYSTAAGVPQYGGIWASSNYWGIGPDTNSLDSTVRIGTMTGGATGYQWAAGYANLKVATVTAQGLQVNGVVTATTFYGTFIGTLTTIASTANTVVSQITNANALYYPTFVNVLNTSTNIGQTEYTTSSFSVNPSTGQIALGVATTATMNALLGVNGNAYVTGILTATNVFVGPWPVNTSTFSGSAGFANTASTVIVQASNTTANYYPSFVSRNNLNTTTSETLFTTSSFFINATSGAVTLGSTTVTNNEIILGITNASSTLTGALQVKGGAGIGGNVYAGGDIYTRGTQVIPLNIQEFVATGAQTTFTPIGGYTVGTAQVFANGINLGSGDFTASNGSTVVLNIPRNAGDIIRIISGGTSSSVNNIKSFSIAMSIAMAM